MHTSGHHIAVLRLPMKIRAAAEHAPGLTAHLQAPLGRGSCLLVGLHCMLHQLLVVHIVIRHGLLHLHSCWLACAREQLRPCCCLLPGRRCACAIGHACRGRSPTVALILHGRTLASESLLCGFLDANEPGLHTLGRTRVAR
jgi:hypothetical protein